MGREIKFRCFDGKAMIYPQIIGINGEDFAWDHNRGWLHNCQDWSGEDGYVSMPVLMQFTGLKDKNGKEIYEGDIMRHREFSTNVVVEWNDGGYWQLSGWDFMRTDPSQGEVIGNIYEHPNHEHGKS